MRLIKFISLLILLFLIVDEKQSQCSNFTVNAGLSADLVTETLYSEDFTGQNGKGIEGTNPKDVSGCTWDIDVSNAILSDQLDYFKVVNDKLESRDLDGICSWISPSVNIQNFMNINLSLNASQISNANRYEASDIFYSEYSIDGGSWTYFSNNGQMTDGLSATTVTVSQSGLNGSTVRIRVKIAVNEDNERFRLDDILVTGQSYKKNICSGSNLTLGGSPTASGFIGSPVVSYQWTPSIGLSSPNVSNPTANPTSNNVYKVIASYIDNGVTCQDSSLLYVNIADQIVISSSTPVCITDTLIISETGGNAQEWLWTSNQGATILNDDQSSSKVVGMTNGEVFTVVTQDYINNCLNNTSSTTVQVNPQPTGVNWTNPISTVCSGINPYHLTGGIPLPIAPDSGYYSGTGVTNNIYDPSTTGYGNSLLPVELMYIYIDNNGCKDTALNTINVRQSPDAELITTNSGAINFNINASGDWAYCDISSPPYLLNIELSTVITAANTLGTTYSIDFGNGDPVMPIVPGFNTTGSYTIPGNYEIKINANDPTFSCQRVYKKNFFYGTNPSIAVSIPANVLDLCAPATIGFPVDVTGNSPGTKYRKYTNDGKPDSSFLNNSLVYTVIHTFDSSSCGYSTQQNQNAFLLGVQAVNGCGVASSTADPIVVSSPPVAKIEETDSIFCINTPITFKDSSYEGKFVSFLGLDYTCDSSDAIAWELSPNTGFTISSGLFGDYANLSRTNTLTHGTTEITLTFQEKGAYTLSLKKVSRCGGGDVFDIDSIKFYIDSLPDAEFTIDKDFDCAPLIVITDNTSKSVNDYNAVFDWTYSTIMEGCDGSAPPSIIKLASDSITSEIYLENFIGQNNKGYIGTYPFDTSSVGWDVSLNGGFGLSDRFFVNKEKFVAVGSNVNGSVWYSPVIDISQYNNISAGLKASTHFTGTTPSRSIATEYKLDGASWTPVTKNSILTGPNFVDSLVSVDGINGSSLQLRAIIDIGGVDSIFFDDIFMDGYSSPDSLDASYTFNKPGSYTINLQTTNVCGVDNYKDTVNAGGLPVVTINAIPDACDTVTIIPSATIDTCFAAMTNYSWTFSGNPPFVTQNSNLQEPAPVFFGSLGTFNVDLIATNVCGPSPNQTTNFSVNESPIIVLNEIDSVCKNSSLQISSVVNQGTPTYNYSWSSNATINNISIPNPIITTNIDEFVYLEVTDSKTCKAYDTIHIDVLDLPTVNAGSPQSVCPEDTAFLTGSVTGAIPPYTLLWDLPSLSSLTILNPFYDMNGTKTFTLTATDDFGCIASNSVTVTERNPPIVTLQPDTNLCNTLIDVQLRASPNGGVWSGNGISPLGVYTPEGIGSFTKYYDFSDANTCNTIDSVVLTVNIPPAPNAGVDIQACLDTGVIVLNGVPFGGDWTGTGVTLAGNYNVLNVDTVNLVYSLGTGNCLVNDSMEILIHPLPTINLDASYQTCISSPDTIIHSFPMGGSWLGNGINPVTGLFSPLIAGIGSHKLIYTYQNPVNGCQNSDSLEITVNSLPTINYDLDTILCLNVNDTINNTSTLAQTHSWTISNGVTSNLKDPIFNINAVGFYNLKYIATSIVGCQDSSQSNFEVLAPPIASYSCPDSGCGPLLVNFTNNSTGKYISYLWNFGLNNSVGNDSTSIDTLPPNHIYNEGVISDTSYFSSLTVTNLCGISIQNTEIKSMPKPVSFFGPTSNVGDCLSGNITLANNSYGLPDSYSWDFGDGSFGNTSDTLFDHFYPPVTSTSFYTIKLRVTNECGADSSSEVISIIPNTLVAAFSTDTTVGCTPLDVEFTQFTVVGSNTQSWDFGDGNFTNTFSPTHTFTDTGSFEVSLAVSDACNFDTAYTTIRVNTSPNVSFSVIDDTLCAGSTFQFNNSSDIGISNNWDFGDNSISSLTNPNHIYTDSGSFRVVLLGTSLTNNCPAYDSVDLVVLPYPEITATSDTSNGCIPLPVNFSSTVNSVGYYLWDFGDGNTSILANPTHNYTTDGYYSVNVRFEDLSGCVDSFDFNITPHPIPVANFNPIQLDTCLLPVNYNFQNLTNGGVSYQWDFGDGTSSPITNPTDSLNPKSYTNAGNYDIKLLTNNSFGCADSITKSIFVKPIPTSQFDLLQLDTCVLPASYSLVNNSLGSVFYSWDLGNGATTNNPNLNSYSYNNSGSYGISLVAMNSYGCLDTSKKTVNISPVPQADFAYLKQDTCALPSNYLFTNLSTGGDFFTWTFDSLGNDIQKDSISFIFNNNGNYQVSLVAQNFVSGCKDSIAYNVTVNSKPEAIFSLDTTIACEPYTSLITNNSVYSNYYFWDFDDGSTGSFFSGSHLFQNSGSYSIKLIAQDLEGCKDSISKSIVINPSPISNYSYIDSDPCYLPIIVDFTNTSSPGSNIQWDFGNGQLSNADSVTITYDSVGVFNIQLVSFNNFNCFDTLINPFDVIFNQVPVAQLNFKDSICLRDTSFLYSNSLFADSLIWDLGNGINLKGDSSMFVSDTSGEFNITLFAYNTNSGCSDTLLNNNLVILPSPTADFTFNHIQGLEPLSGTIEFINNSLGASSYFWDFGFGDDSNLETPTYYYKYSFDGTYYYTLYTTNSDECIDSLTKDLYIEFKKALYIPNAISPEATNFEVSRFIPKGTGMNYYKIEIFDLFGNVIWESTALDDEGQPTESWDGKYEGIGVEPDVYIWKVEAQFKDESFWGGQKPIEENILRKTGTLTVIR